MPSKYYAVAVGAQPGIYSSWYDHTFLSFINFSPSNHLYNTIFSQSHVVNSFKKETHVLFHQWIFIIPFLQIFLQIILNISYKKYISTGYSFYRVDFLKFIGDFKL